MVVGKGVIMGSKITGKEYQLSKIFSKEFEYYIPAYQRPYAWTEEQTEKLFDDLYNFFVDNGIDVVTEEDADSSKDGKIIVDQEPILLNDEDTWNPEFYTNEKLDYRKLLIYFLQDYLNSMGNHFL